MKIGNFSKIQSKIFEKYIFFESITSFSCRGCETFSSDMRIIILLSVIKKEQAFSQRYKQTDGRTQTFLKFPRHTDPNDI